MMKIENKLHRLANKAGTRALTAMAFVVLSLAAFAGPAAAHSPRASLPSVEDVCRQLSASDPAARGSAIWSKHIGIIGGDGTTGPTFPVFCIPRA